jgi:cell wall-associated NlpC family hydrolase
VRDWVKVIVDGYIRLLSSSPHHIIYRHLSDEPLGDPPALEPIIAPFSPDDPSEDELPPMEEEEGEEYSEEASVPEAIFPEPEIPETFEPPIYIDPPPDSLLENPVIHFQVEVKGYPSWQFLIIIYPAGKDEPIATYSKILPASETRVSVSWSQIFPEQKPPSGTYTYDILVRGVEQQIAPLVARGWDDKRLADQARIDGFTVNAYLSNITSPTIIFYVRFRVLNGNVRAAWVEFRNFQQILFETVYLSWDGEWWSGSWVLTFPPVSETSEAVKRWGEWEIIACAEVTENGRTRVVRERVQIVPIFLTISGYAHGYAIHNGSGYLEIEDLNLLAPYVGWQVHFYAFINVIWKVGTNYWLVWYSDDNFSWDQLQKSFVWIHDRRDNLPTVVYKLPESLRQYLNLQVTWLRFRNVVRCQEHHLNGIERWYGMDLEDWKTSPSLKYVWTIDRPGVSHWGIKISWWMQQNGTKPETKGKAVLHRIVYLYPTDRKGGHQVIRLGSDEKEYHPTLQGGWAERVGNDRFNRVEVGNKNKILQKLWLPNPWYGRIAARERWDASSITFDPDDPFFDAYTDEQAKQAAMTRQAEFHARLMEWASSFLNTPYAWGGQTRGGFQSRSPSDFTCSADLNPDPRIRESHKTDRVSKIGSSLYLYGGYGYGIDCSGFVGETCYIATNRRVPPDDLGTSVLMSWDKKSVSPKENVFVGSTLIAKRVAYHNADDRQHHYVGVSYIRPGDFIVIPDHVVYAVSKWDHDARQIRVIEAHPGGKVLVQIRSATSLGLKWVARRWVVR